jgi:hypothetical protein
MFLSILPVGSDVRFKIQRMLTQIYSGCGTSETPCGIDKLTYDLEGWKLGDFEQAKMPEYYRCWAPKCVGHCPGGN